MNLGSLKIPIGVDVEPLKRGMATAKQSLLSLAQEARISEQHLAALTQQMEKEAQASQRSASATKQLAALDRELRAAKSQLTAILTGESAAAQQVAQKYDLLTAAQRKQLTSVKEQITAQKALQEAELQTALAAEKTAQRQAAAAAKKPTLQQTGRGIADIGMGLTGAVTAPILAGAAGVLAAGTQLDQALDKIRIGTGASGAQLAAFEASAKRVGASVPNSFSEVGQAIGELAQRTGLTGPALENLARQTLTLNRLVGGDLNETIRQSARVFGDWGIAAKDQSGALDLLFRAHQRTGISMEKLEETLVRSGAPLRQLGFSFGEAAALIGKFEKEGVNSELVLGSLRIAMGRLAKAGITDAHQAFLQIIESIKGAGSASQATALAVKAFGARAGPDMAAAIREGRFEVEKLWKSIEGGHDSIAKAAKDTDDFGEKFAVLRNKVLVALQPLGSALMKVLGQMADALIRATPFLTRLVEGFTKLPGGAQLAVGGLLAFMAGLGPVLVGIGRFVAAYPAMQAGLAAIRASALATSLSALLPALGALAGPIALVGAAVGLLAVGWTRDWGGMRTTTETFWAGLKEVVGDGVSWLGERMRTGMQEFGRNFRAGLEVLRPWAETAFAGVKSAFQQLWERLVEIAQTMFPRVVRFFQNLAANARAGVDYIMQRGRAAQERRPIFERLGGQNFVRKPAGWLEQQIAIDQGLMGGNSGALGAGGRGKTGGGFDFSQFGGDKQTPAQKEQTRYTEEMTQAHERLSTLLAGEDNIAAQVAARYHLLTQAQRDNLTAVLQQIHHQQILQQSQKAYTTDLGKLNAEIRRLKAGHDAEASGVDALKEKYPGLSRAMLETMNNAIQWRKHLAEVRQEASQVAEALRGIHAGLLQATTQSRVAAEAMERFGQQEWAKKFHFANAEDILPKLNDEQFGQAVQGASEKAMTDLQNQLKAAREQRAGLYGKIEAPGGGVTEGLRDRPGQILRQVLGPDLGRYLSPETLASAKALAAELAETERVISQGAAAVSVYRGEWEKADTVIGTAGVNLELLQRKTRVLATGTRDERDAFLQFGVTLGDLPKDVQQVLVATLALDRKFTESQAIIQQFTKGTEQVFGEMFHNIFEKGFKHFGGNLVRGFSQLFQQIAAQFLASKLTDLIMGKQDTAGNRSGGFWGSLFNIGLQAATGGVGGGGGGGGGAATGPVLGPPIPAGMASIQSRHAFVPRNVSPQFAGAGGGGGGNISITQNIQAVDARSFRQNERQLAADAGRMVQTLQRRNG